MVSPSSSSDENRHENIMFVTKGLVRSSQPIDVRRGIALLEGSIVDTPSSLSQQKDKLYLIALGYCSIREYSVSMHYLKQCLEIEPLWTEALTLKKRVECLQGKAATSAGAAAATVASAAVRKTLNFVCATAEGIAGTVVVAVVVAEISRNRVLQWRIQNFFSRFL